MNAEAHDGLDDLIDIPQYPLADDGFRRQCAHAVDTNGVLVLPGFMRSGATDAVLAESLARRDRAFYSTEQHNVYLTGPDPTLDDLHPRNRLVTSSKGCITDDIVPPDSPLRRLYDSGLFRDYLCAVLGETELHNYADPLSSINVHYADDGQELGWHFDNSSFAVTLMIQPPLAGGKFEYVRNVRDAQSGEMGFATVAQVLDDEIEVESLAMPAGTLVLFRGRDSMHRVTPVAGERTRILTVLAYNNTAGVSLSESARMTFYGRLG